ncbi:MULTISPECIES: alternate-type signal peptide domain-containing protein [Microbacterium]|uniref:alternate-type signal peptide domain-containing protein n=1 Tax=Microbacterium TaxID=33882 RepID=UPI00278445F3|nr:MULTISPECIES: alternate-type signal peptide domain-containing protein [Microbacterium]MDQ1075534.1 alternate signal-mediated exported protein [Microbacterium sp. SORGH_AS_0969]MDQ1115773.1 alternate signal-mediated exported protein [Microbacterium testaceum]
MNKLAKGSIAAAAAVVLLGGGMGSMAYWNASVWLPGANFSTGEVSMSAAPNDYTYYVNGDRVTSEELAATALVPGDVVDLDVEVTVRAIGAPAVLTLPTPEFSGNAGLASTFDYTPQIRNDEPDLEIRNTVVGNKFNVSGEGQFIFRRTFTWASWKDTQMLANVQSELLMSNLVLDQVTEPLEEDNS